MLDELTQEQAFELFLYHFKEPFGEVREDLRMARVLQFYYDAKRGKKGTPISIGELTLYTDIAESAHRTRTQDSLMQQLSGLAAKNGK